MASISMLILHGRVMDPESRLDVVRNVGIRDGKIQAVTSQPIIGRTTIDGKGLVVASGFIDLHQHGQIPENYRAQVMDGVTSSLELEVGAPDIDAWYAERAARRRERRQHWPYSRAHEGMNDPGDFPSGAAIHKTASDDELNNRATARTGLKQGAVAVRFAPPTRRAIAGKLEVFRQAIQGFSSCTS
jgi:hypothetical protein